MTNIRSISPTTLSEWLQKKEAVLIDVREVVEYKEKSIPNSINLPLSKVTVDSQHMPKHIGKKLVIHCKSGKRSMMACEKLTKEGIECDIWNLEGGIDNWQEKGFKTLLLRKNIFPAQSQVQLIISLMILLGLGLNYILQEELWLILPLIAGLGLLNAGLTGWCGMMRLVSIMPWNKD